MNYLDNVVIGERGQCVNEIGAIDFLYVSLFLFWMVYLYFVKEYGYWEQRKVPLVPAVFPLGSLTKVVVGANHDESMLDKIYKDFKTRRFVGFNNIREPQLMLRDPELIKSVMNDDFEYFESRGLRKTHPNDYLLVNIMSKSGKEWKDTRDKLASAYDIAHFCAIFRWLWKGSDSLQQEVDKLIVKQNIIDVKDVLVQFTMRLFGTMAFGNNIISPTEEDTAFYKVCRDTMKGGFRVKLKFFIYEAFPVAAKVHLFDMLSPDINEAAKNKVRFTLESRETNKEKAKYHDFLQQLTKVRHYKSLLEDRDNPSKDYDNESKGLTIEEITSESFAFFTFGHEKTSRIAQFCLYEIACNETIQEKVFQEVQSLSQKYNNDLRCLRVLDEMVYLNKVVSETLRRYPICSTIYRECTRGFKIPNSNLLIEKGLRLMIPIYSLHHDSKYFPDPYTFDPERFDTDNCQKRHPCVFIPFGYGPRKCTGYRFGVMTVKMAVARLVHNFYIGVTPDTPVPLQFTNESCMTEPTKAIKLTFTRR